MKKFCLIFIVLAALALLAQIASAAAAAAPATHSWSQQINTTKRFTVLTAFGSAAVLDNETGLVWEQSPSGFRFSWVNAQIHCNQSTVGDRLGWRLPTVQELASLVDPAGSSPTLSFGHPFSNVQADFYAASTTLAPDSTSAWVVNFHGLGAPHVVFLAKDTQSFVWCVRGGQGVDPQ